MRRFIWRIRRRHDRPSGRIREVIEVTLPSHDDMKCEAKRRYRIARSRHEDSQNGGNKRQRYLGDQLKEVSMEHVAH